MKIHYLKSFIIGLCLLSATPMWSQMKYTGKHGESICRSARRAIESFMEMTVDAAREKELAPAYIEGVKEKHVLSESVFYPDFDDVKNDGNVVSYESYINRFIATYPTYLEESILNPEKLSIHLSEMTFGDIYHLEDNIYGVRVEVNYRLKILSLGTALYDGKSQAIVVFNDMTELTDFAVRQILQKECTFFALSKKTKQQDLDELMASAKKGDAKAQFSLALHYLSLEDMDNMFQWVLKSAKSGWKEAYSGVASCYYYGVGTVKDIQKAISWFEKAFKNGDVFSATMLGSMYVSGTDVPVDYAKAYPYLSFAAERNDAFSQAILGLYHEFGYNNTRIDLGKAVEYYRLAAEQEDPEGLFRYGLHHVSESYLPADHPKAIELLEKATDKGHMMAPCTLGNVYEYYIEDPIEKLKAVKWYQTAADRGLPEAFHCLGNLYRYGNLISKDYMKAVSYYEKGIELGHAGCMDELGVCYLYALGVKYDPPKAVSYFKMSADGGYLNGYCNYGKMLEKGNGIEKNEKEAFTYFEYAANHGHLSSMVRCAKYYERSEHIQDHWYKAYEWWKKAAEIGSDYAKNMLKENPIYREFEAKTSSNRQR